MNLLEFNALQEQERYDVTFRQGTFIDYKFINKHRYSLYAVFMFFVEVEYNVEENKIINSISFEEGKLLNKYAFYRKLIE